MQVDVAIIGAGAAGLTAGIFAGEAARERGLSIVVLEGARKPGAKILVSGGGRCNVTNERIVPEDFWGGPRPTIRNVLRAFDEHRTIAWMQEMGVELKLEPTGKYFPTTDRARTVLEALMRRLERSGARLLPGVRVTDIARAEDRFRIDLREGEPCHARRVIVATGGLSLPKSGSDGWGLAAVRRLGHTIRTTVPALVPLVLQASRDPAGRFGELSGVTLQARLGLYDGSGRRLEERVDSLLFTHFGISGPAALDLSRHLLVARQESPDVGLQVCLGHPKFSRIEEADRWLLDEAARHPRRSPAAVLAALLPERMARLFAEDIPGNMSELSRARRHLLAERLARLPLRVEGARGWAFAETTAGGVELREVDHRTMESRVVPGLHLCGEMLDVDGRIGGFNFQWAWATGYLAGRGAVGLLSRDGT